MIPGTLTYRYRWAIAWMVLWLYVSGVLWARGL